MTRVSLRARGALDVMHGHAANVLRASIVHETPDGHPRVTRLPRRAPWLRRRTSDWHVVYRDDEEGRFVAWILARKSLARVLRALVDEASTLEF